ncbi:hypothetical protein [Amycolatopsis alba]|uniref:DUF304 domain-containing protein n=1 Tax=Amycolatopsis alba DSM 44262 TaxID=1125972 RepID=A0A229R944_AMYAL|nr:hypothetical protein [Amycolatopsis alba]OXM43180.1 hypothetical protein CFP75_39375 [Amycolatopsis alba DSM 44262]
MHLGDAGLLPGERLLWEGASRTVPIVEKSDLVLVPGLLFIGFFFYPANRASVSMIAYTIPTVIVLLWIGQGVNRYLKARASSFVVTDRRVVVRRKGADVLSRYLSDLGPPQLAERPDGTGTISFGGDGFAAGFLGSTRNRDAGSALPRLAGIEDARRVRDLIATAQHSGR